MTFPASAQTIRGIKSKAVGLSNDNLRMARKVPSQLNIGKEDFVDMYCAIALLELAHINSLVKILIRALFQTGFAWNLDRNGQETRFKRKQLILHWVSC